MTRKDRATLPPEDVVEEQFDNQGTGVEFEELDDSFQHKPWDPELIRVDPKSFSLRNVIDMIREKEIELAPDFQRGNVWKDDQKCRLIESIFLRIPLPAFYFSSDNSGNLQVVDGLQRLSTIRDFVGDEGKPGFKLSHMEYLNDQLGGKRFSELQGTIWARRFYSTQIIVNVVDPQTPDAVKFDIFRRINTGGSPLSQQEIRHCMSGSRSREFLKSLANEISFQEATGYALQNHKRMADREVILRFCAFALRGGRVYYESMSQLLNWVTNELDNVLTDEELELLRHKFIGAMSNAIILFGEYAFRKWPTDNEKKNPISRPLFDVWSVSLIDVDPVRLMTKKEEIVEDARAKMKSDMEFLRSISYSTGNIKQIDTRFETVSKILQRAGLA